MIIVLEHLVAWVFILCVSMCIVSSFRLHAHSVKHEQYATLGALLMVAAAVSYGYGYWSIVQPNVVERTMFFQLWQMLSVLLLALLVGPLYDHSLHTYCKELWHTALGIIKPALKYQDLQFHEHPPEKREEIIASAIQKYRRTGSL